MRLDFLAHGRKRLILNYLTFSSFDAPEPQSIAGYFPLFSHGQLKTFIESDVCCGFLH